MCIEQSQSAGQLKQRKGGIQIWSSTRPVIDPRLKSIVWFRLFFLDNGSEIFFYTCPFFPFFSLIKKWNIFYQYFRIVLEQLIHKRKIYLRLGRLRLWQNRTLKSNRVVGTVFFKTSWNIYKIMYAQAKI